MTFAWLYTLIPAALAVAGAAVAVRSRPGPLSVSAIQHFAAGVVFAAAAGEILPDVKHGGSAMATFIGGFAGVAVMLMIRQLERFVTGPAGLVTTVGVDILIDGLVLGLGFAAGAKAGMLLMIALSLEVVFLGLALANALTDSGWKAARVVAVAAGLMVLLPLGALMAMPVSAMSPAVVTGFLAFGLVALLYLVTEELLVEAHKTPDRPWITALFFAGFLILLLLEEAMG